jgi:hypothetical protein
MVPHTRVGRPHMIILISSPHDTFRRFVHTVRISLLYASVVTDRSRLVSRLFRQCFVLSQRYIDCPFFCHRRYFDSVTALFFFVEFFNRAQKRKI